MILPKGKFWATPDLGEIFLCMKIYQLLRVILEEDEGHIDETINWCWQAVGEQANDIRDARSLRGGMDKLFKAVRGLTGSRPTIVEAAEAAILLPTRHAVVIKTLQNFCRFYRIAPLTRRAGR